MRIWPQSLAGRLALILAGALLLWSAGGFFLYWQEQRIEGRIFYTHNTVQRVATSYRILERSHPRARRQLLRAINGPGLRIRSAARLPAKGEVDEWTRALAAHVEQILARRGRVQERVMALGLLQPGPAPGPARMPTGTQPGISKMKKASAVQAIPRRPRASLAIARYDGGYWIFSVISPHQTPRWLWRLGILAAIAAALTIAFALWAAGRLSRPIERLAQAADRLGTDVNAPPLSEAGSREVRQAARAFNRMQTRLQKLIAGRTMMLAAISHDLRTMLTRLRLRVEFINDEEQRDKAVADLDRMDAMLTAGLDFARDDHDGEAQMEIDLAALLGGLAEDAAALGHQADYAGPDQLSYRAAPVALRRALTNLCENALQHGGVLVLALEEVAAGEIEIIIADRGPGVPEHLREQVFTPFFRADVARSPHAGGMGLGLAIARTAVRGHGGDITIKDRVGGGAIFVVRLPLAQIDGAAK